MIVISLALIISTVLALALVPMFSTLAKSIGLVDKPDANRKLHANAIPMVGGLVLFTTVLIIAPLAIYFGVKFQPFFLGIGEAVLGWIPVDFGRRLIRIHPEDYRELLGLTIGSSILVLIGFIDDRFGMRGKKKLAGQIVATSVLIYFGFQFDKMVIAGFEINFGVFSILIVYAWVLGAINSVNLLDGADGIAATIGVIMSMALSLLAIYQGQMLNAIITMSITGALLGFLRYNFPPAKVYLGDTGSMLIGFLLAAMAIRCTFKQTSAFAFFAPLALLAIPFIDTSAAIVRRRLTGRSIFAVDRGHLHHSLMKRGYSPKISLLWVALLSTMTAAGGVLSFVNEQSEYAIIAIMLVVIVMLSCRIFGIAEFQLVSRKASTVAKSVFKIDRTLAHNAAVHVQGSRDWAQQWKLLSEFADEHDLAELTLDLNAPWLHESFNATWKKGESVGNEGQDWKSELPLIANARCFGRLELTGAGSLDHHRAIAEALKIAQSIELTLTDNIELATPTNSPKLNLVENEAELRAPNSTT